jgi:uncharacterized protein GlcG (DUF336 family)
LVHYLNPEEVYTISNTPNGLTTFHEGVPIKNEHGDIIGAIGVSGSSIENDHLVAEASVLGILKK